MSRAYLRLDPRAYEKKVIDQGYPLPLFAAFVAVLCEAEHQPTRGRFRSERVLRAVLEDAKRFIPELVKRGDLVRLDDGSVYVDGWDEWQEGDWKVGERVRRIRDRRRAAGEGVTAETVTPVTPPTVTPETVDAVYTPSDGGRQSVIDGGGVKRSDTPQPPSRGGRRRRAGQPIPSSSQYDSMLERDSADGAEFRDLFEDVAPVEVAG